MWFPKYIIVRRKSVETDNVLAENNHYLIFRTISFNTTQYITQNMGQTTEPNNWRQQYAVMQCKKNIQQGGVSLLFFVHLNKQFYIEQCLISFQQAWQLEIIMY